MFYLATWVLVAVCEILVVALNSWFCCTWDLFPLAGSNLGPLPALGVWSLSHFRARQNPSNSSNENITGSPIPPWQSPGSFRNINQAQSIRYSSLKSQGQELERRGDWPGNSATGEGWRILDPATRHSLAMIPFPKRLWFQDHFSGPGSHPSGSFCEPSDFLLHLFTKVGLSQFLVSS